MPSRATSPAVLAADKATLADPSPVDVLLTPDESRLLVLNQGTGTLAPGRCGLSGKLLDEAACGRRPSAVALCRMAALTLVDATDSGELSAIRSQRHRSLTPAGHVKLGFHPRGVAISPDGARPTWPWRRPTPWPWSISSKMECVQRIDVGRWPRHLALSPDGTRLAVGATATAACRSSIRSRASSSTWRSSSASTSARWPIEPRRQVRLLPVDGLSPEPDHGPQHPPGLGAGQPHRPRAARRARAARGDLARPARAGDRRPARHGPDARRATGASAPPRARTSCWSIA